MTSIDRMTQLLTTLRQELDGQVRAKRAETPNVSNNETSNKIGEASATETLKMRISRELKRYDLKSQDNRKHARRLFIESIVTSDFGEEISRDPKFSFLVRDIETSISADTQALEKLDNLLVELQKA